MKLRFDLLSLPLPTSHEESLRGRAGTVGTPHFYPERLSPVGTKRGGTHGDEAQRAYPSGATELSCPLKSPPGPPRGSGGVPREEGVSPPSPTFHAPSLLAQHEVDFDSEAFEERAAIMEFDGGLSRAAAEAAARSALSRAYWFADAGPIEHEN